MSTRQHAAHLSLYAKALKQAGATRGFVIGHVVPEAAERGPIAAVKDGDIIIIDVDKRRLDIDISPDELRARLAEWSPPAPRYTSGIFAKYARLVADASRGAVTDLPAV